MNKLKQLQKLRAEAQHMSAELGAYRVELKGIPYNSPKRRAQHELQDKYDDTLIQIRELRAGMMNERLSIVSLDDLLDRMYDVEASFSTQMSVENAWDQVTAMIDYLEAEYARLEALQAT